MQLIFVFLSRIKVADDTKNNQENYICEYLKLTYLRLVKRGQHNKNILLTQNRIL